MSINQGEHIGLTCNALLSTLKLLDEEEHVGSFFQRVLLALALLSFLSLASQAEQSYIPPKGFVPDEQTAVRIAEAVLSPIYGADQIAREKPFTAVLKGEVWTVEGHLPASQNRGGVALVEISKVDGRILRVTHGK